MLIRALPAEPAPQPKALPQRADGETGDGEAEVGDGVQGLPRLRRRLHEYAGEGRRGREGGRKGPGPCLLVGGKAARFWAALRSVWPRLLRVEAEVRLVRLLLV